MDVKEDNQVVKKKSDTQEPKLNHSSIKYLLRCLQNDSSSSVYNTLVKIRSKLSGTSGISEFYKAGGLAVILPLLEKPKLLDLTVSIFANCCVNSEARNWIIENNGIAPILQAFKCLASESVQNRCCRALANLALSPKGAFILHKENILANIVKFLTSTTNSLSLLTALRAIRVLASGSFYKSILIEEDGIVPIVDLLKSESQDVVLCATKTLANLTENCNQEVAQEIQKSRGLGNLLSLCSSQKKECKENSLLTLVNLSTHSVIRPMLGNIGVIPLLIRLIDNPVPGKPDIISLITALCFYCRESVNRVKIRDSDGLKTLLNLLRSDDYQSAHTRIIHSLLAFRYDEASLDVLMELGLEVVLVSHLNNYTMKNKKNHFEVTKTEPNIILETSSATERKKNLSKANPNEISREQEIEIISVMKADKLSKVFCIHSPSYQIVQSELFDKPNYTDGDSKYSEAHSPSSVSSFCMSPDRSSLDWSLPSSPSSNRPNWSPCSSPSPSTSSNQGFDVSSRASSPTSTQYSPILHSDNYSDAETKSVNELQLLDLSAKQIPKRRHRKRTISDSSSPKKSKMTRHSFNSTTNSSLPTDTKTINLGIAEEETIGGQIMLLLSHLSQVDKHSVSIATKQCIEAVLNYLSGLPFISSRAQRLLIRLFGNYNCFEVLILFNVIDLVNEKIVVVHSANECQYCAKLKRIKHKLTSVLTSVSESGYGIGILSHIILTGTFQEIARCVLAIPHMIRGHYQLRKLLCDCGGLSHLLQLLDSEYKEAAIQSLSTLCKNCFSQTFKSYISSSTNELKETCVYKNISYDIKFILDDCSIVNANRKILCENSTYFNAMLKGSFIESKESEIKLEDTSTNALLIVFHHLHGCNVQNCSPFKENDANLNIELITLCDKFLIDNLSKIVENELIMNLTPKTVKSVYAHSIKYNLEELSTAVLRYVMVGEMSNSERKICFQDLNSSPSIHKVFIGDIKETILKQFPESKAEKNYVVEDQVTLAE